VFLQSLLTPNGRLWDLVLTGKESEEGREEAFAFEANNDYNRFKL
jgi:hypothetical protein